MRKLAITTVMFAPAIAFAAGTPKTFSDVANLLLTIIGQATLMLMIAAVAAYFFNIAFNMLKLSKGESSDWRNNVMWGIAAIFVMVSIWGIIQILQYTLFTPGGGTSGGGSGSRNCATFGGCAE